MRKYCAHCGYKTEEKDLKCPICGGPLFPGIGADRACDPREEAEWNSGYHNDFEEGRKTGEYCDPRFEKYANGGEHYHGTQKTTYTANGSGSTPELTMTPKGAVILALIVSLCIPFVGPIIIIAMTKGRVTEGAAAARRAAIAFLILTFVSAFFASASGILDQLNIF